MQCTANPFALDTCSYLLPRLFKPEHLGELDADEYDIVEPLPADQAVQVRCMHHSFD